MAGLYLNIPKSVFTELKAELAALRERQRWIPVSERLPEEDGEVLVYSPEWLIDLGSYEWKRGGWYTAGIPAEGVTHWKPVEPPDVGE